MFRVAVKVSRVDLKNKTMELRKLQKILVLKIIEMSA